MCLEVCKGCPNAVATTHTFNTQLNICNPNLTPDSASLRLAAMWTLPPRVSQAPQAYWAQAPASGIPILVQGAAISPVSCSQKPWSSQNPSHSLTPSPHLPPVSPPLFKSSSSAYPPASTCMWSWCPHPHPCPLAGPSDATTAFSKPAPCCQNNLSKMQI